MRDFDQEHSEYTICPYCKSQFGDSWEHNAETRPNKTQCDNCGGTFWQWADYDVTYYTAKIDALADTSKEGK